MLWGRIGRIDDGLQVIRGRLTRAEWAVQLLAACGKTTWTEHKPRFEKFQAGIERMFAEECGS
jgi:hypothetical protein